MPGWHNAPKCKVIAYILDDPDARALAEESMAIEKGVLG